MNLAISPLKKFIFYYYSVMLKIKMKEFEREKKDLTMQPTLKLTMKSSAYIIVAAIRIWYIHWEKKFRSGNSVQVQVTSLRNQCEFFKFKSVNFSNHTLKRVTSENALVSMLLIVAASKHQFFPYESEIHYQAGFRKCRETRYQIANIC